MAERPWRAVASLRLGPGLPAITLGRTSARTREGLGRFVARHEAAGATVAVWQVQALPAVDELLRDSQRTPTSPG